MVEAISLAYGYGWRNSGDLAINQGSITYLNSLFPKSSLQIISMFAESSDEFRKSRRMLAMDENKYELIGGPIHYDPKTQSAVEKFVHLVGDGKRYVSDRVGLHNVKNGLGTRMAANIRNTDFLFYNGGNLIHHDRSLAYLLGVLYPLQLARQYDVPYGILPHTVFNLEGRYDHLVLSLLENSEFVWTRDKRSYDYLTTELSLDCPVRNGLDTAFFLPDVELSEGQTAVRNPDRTKVTFVPRFSTLGDTGELKSDETERQLKNFLRILSKNGFEVDVTVQTKVEEEWVHENRELLESNGISVFKSFSPDALRSHYEERDLVVTMRLHAGIFALSVGTPSIGIYRNEWGHKTPGTWENLGIEKYAVACEELSVDKLLSLCDDVINEKTELEETIIERIKAKKEYMVNETESIISKHVE